MSNRKAYDEALLQMNWALTEMGAAAEKALEQAFSLLDQPDDALAARIIEGDKTVDEQERRIEQQCLALLLRQQPVATDLRRVSTALNIVTDIERIGDHAADIAEISRHLKPGWAAQIPVREDLRAMEAAAMGMVRQAIAAFVAVDLKKADEVIDRDDEVDALFNQIKTDLAGYIAGKPDEVDAALDLLMIDKYIERLGDHSCNIAQWVHFLKNGIYRGQQIV